MATCCLWRQKVQLFTVAVCCALPAATICDKAVELHHVGGVHGANLHPTEFLSLLLKLLQLQPDESIVLEYINAGTEDFKSVTAAPSLFVHTES